MCWAWKMIKDKIFQKVANKQLWNAHHYSLGKYKWKPQWDVTHAIRIHMIKVKIIINAGKEPQPWWEYEIMYPLWETL